MKRVAPSLLLLFVLTSALRSFGGASSVSKAASLEGESTALLEAVEEVSRSNEGIIALLKRLTSGSGTNSFPELESLVTEAISKWNAAYDHLDGVSDFSVADNRALRQAMEPFIRQLHALSKPLTAEQRQTLRPPPPLEVHTRLSPSDTMLCKILPRFSQYHKIAGLYLQPGSSWGWGNQWRGMVSVVALALATDRMPRFHFGFPSLQDSADSSVDDSVNVIPLARIVKQHTKYVPPLLIARYFDPPLAIPSWRDLDFSPQSSCENALFITLPNVRHTFMQRLLIESDPRETMKGNDCIVHHAGTSFLSSLRDNFLTSERLETSLRGQDEFFQTASITRWLFHRPSDTVQSDLEAYWRRIGLLPYNNERMRVELSLRSTNDQEKAENGKLGCSQELDRIWKDFEGSQKEGELPIGKGQSDNILLVGIQLRLNVDDVSAAKRYRDHAENDFVPAVHRILDRVAEENPEKSLVMFFTSDVNTFTDKMKDEFELRGPFFSSESQAFSHSSGITDSYRGTWNTAELDELVDAARGRDKRTHHSIHDESSPVWLLDWLTLSVCDIIVSSGTTFANSAHYRSSLEDLARLVDLNNRRKSRIGLNRLFVVSPQSERRAAAECESYDCPFDMDE